MAITGATNRGSGTSSTSGTTLTHTPGAIVAVGKQLVTTVSMSASSVQSITDAVGNVWVFASRSVASNSYAVELWVCNVEVALAAATVITTTFAAAVVDKCVASREYTVAAGKMLVETTEAAPIDNTLTGAGFGSQTFSALSNIERLYVRGGQKVSNSTTAITVSTNFTSWALTLRSRNNAAAVILRAEERVVTGTTSGASNPTLAVSVITSATFAAFEEVTIPLDERLIEHSAQIDNDALSASGVVDVNASGSTAISDDSLSAAASVAINASASNQVADDSLSATFELGTGGASLTHSAQIADDALTVTGSVEVAAAHSAQVDDDSLSATATVGDPPDPGYNVGVPSREVSQIVPADWSGSNFKDLHRRLRPLSESSVVAWFDPQTGITLNGADVSAWANRGSLGGTVAQATGSAQPLYVASGGPFGGLPHIQFTQANNDRLTSSLSIASWKFLHDGTGMWVAMRYYGDADGVLMDTAALSGTLPGVVIRHTSGTGSSLTVTNGSAASGFVAATPGSTPNATALSLIFAYQTGIANPLRVYTAAASVVNANETGSPSAANPNAAMTVAGRSASGQFSGRIADVIVGTGMPSYWLRQRVFAFLARSS